MPSTVETSQEKSITPSIVEVRLGQIGLATRQDRYVRGLVTADVGDTNIALALYNKKARFAGLIVVPNDQEIIPDLEEIIPLMKLLRVDAVWLAVANLDSPQLSLVVRERRACLPRTIRDALMESDITTVGRVKTVDPLPALLVDRKTGICTAHICGNVSGRERERGLLLTATDALAHKKVKVPITRGLWAYRPTIPDAELIKPLA